MMQGRYPSKAFVLSVDKPVCMGSEAGANDTLYTTAVIRNSQEKMMAVRLTLTGKADMASVSGILFKATTVTGFTAAR